MTTDEKTLVDYFASRGITYDPATGKGYDIEGAIVVDNGTTVTADYSFSHLPGYVPETESALPPAKDTGISPTTLALILGGLFALIILTRGKKRR